MIRFMRSSAFLRFGRERFSLAGVVLAFALAGFAQTARAGDNDKAVARAHYETATRLYEIREYDKALLEYKSAYLAQPDPAFLFNIGQCYRKLGQAAEALNFFQQYLKKAPPDDPNRRQVEARIRDIEAEAKLKAEAAQAAPAQVPPPAFSPPLPATPTISAAAATVEEAPAVPRSSGRGLRTAGVVCGAAGLASIGTAIYYYTRARSFSDKVSNAVTPNTSDEQAGKNAETMQWVFYGVGAGALATGTLLYLLGWPTADASRSLAGVAPMIGPGLAGISAHGAF
jgi:tetratricopeptide (TPR) repeat protein